MDINTQNYLYKYIFSRFKEFNNLRFDAESRTISNSQYKIKIPIIKISNVQIIKILGENVPFFRTEDPEIKISMIDQDPNNLIINWDFIGETFDHLALKYENYFSASEDLLPILDMKIFLIMNLFNSFMNLEFKSFNGKKFTLCISHDIDRTGDSRLYRFITHFYQAIKQKRIKLLFHGLFGKNEELNIEKIIKYTKKYNSKSTWFVLTRYGLRRNADYNLNSKHFKKGIKSIIHANHEIGLHLPYMDLTKNNLDREISKIYNLNKKVSGIRIHHLRGKYPDILQYFEKSGVRFDSTFGFNDRVSYRFGTSVPFHPLIESNNVISKLNIYEIPLNIMDIHISDFIKFKDIFKRYVKILAEVRGVCVINWHNNRFNNTKYGKIWEESFDYVLNQSSIGNAWITSIEAYLDYYESDIFT